jgi:photosystem II stability/assembly factor-like uncharacterized protein
MKRILFSFSIFIFYTTTLFAQTEATPASERLEVDEERQKLAESSVAGALSFTNIGPTVMSGRIVDPAVNPENPAEFYAAFASGGLWHTSNFGTTFTPLFEDQPVMTIGDIAVDWPSKTIWLGSGESNSSRSSYAGDGMYKSTDGGKTWQHLGLEETHHIGRVILHPENDKVAWVAAVGHLYSNNPERGVFKTKDGGQTWGKALFVNDSAGAIDLAIHPENPDVLYAAMWERDRKAWNFKGSGSGSGIFKSTDGGESWNRISNGDNGFPFDAGVGRIGLAISHQNPEKVYAILDNQNRREKKEKDEEKLTKEVLRNMSKDEFLQLSDLTINEYLDEHNFPEAYNAVDIKKAVEAGDYLPVALVDYLEDANAMLFDVPVKGAEVYMTNDGGATWAKTHEEYIDDLYYSYGYYFGNIRVHPNDDQKLYIMGVPILRSDDGGKSWKTINGDNQHVDHHALWISKDQPGLLINGNDGGVNISWDDGESWIKCNNLPVGQFYAVNVDQSDNYHVYGGLQDNGVWHGAHNYEYSNSWRSTGEYDYQNLMGGDGMQVEIDSRDNNTVYTGFQFGNYFRIDKNTGRATAIQPRHMLGERPLRFNWQTPIHLSVHNQDILYLGSNKFHRSMNRGDNWETLSEDLTHGGKKGNVPYGTLTSIDESPLMFGLIYAGTDDGRVHISKDGGNTWQDISEGLEPMQWVSRVEASAFDKKRAYVALNGYRWDRFDAMVYVTDDYGATWKKIGEDLPAEPVNVIKEDPQNPDLLYVGTDHGVYFSLDRGKHFMALDHALPKVAVHDLVVQEKASDLIIGTHGRSIYRLPVGHLQQLDENILAGNLHIFDVSAVTYSERWGNYRSWSKWNGFYEPEIEAPLFTQQSGDMVLRVRAEDDNVLFEEEMPVDKGLQYVKYDLSISENEVEAFKKRLKKNEEFEDDHWKDRKNGKSYLIPGTYRLELIKDGQTRSVNFEMKPPKEKPVRKPQKKTP